MIEIIISEIAIIILTVSSEPFAILRIFSQNRLVKAVHTDNNIKQIAIL